MIGFANARLLIRYYRYKIISLKIKCLVRYAVRLVSLRSSVTIVVAETSPMMIRHIYQNVLAPDLRFRIFCVYLRYNQLNRLLYDSNTYFQLDSISPFCSLSRKK